MGDAMTAARINEVTRSGGAAKRPRVRSSQRRRAKPAGRARAGQYKPKMKLGQAQKRRARKARAPTRRAPVRRSRDWRASAFGSSN